MGVMHSVDKWLDSDELKQDEVNRAATMREKTLQIVEKKQAEIERLQDRNNKCIYLSDDETTEFCVDSICPQFKTEKMIKTEAINDFIKKCKEKQEFLVGEDNKYKGYVSIEDLESLKKCD